MINPVFLRTFLELAKRKGFTATAKALHMTQPGVSQHLTWLEDHFGTALALREGRTFELTTAGEKVVQYAERLFTEHAALKESLSVDDPHQGVCRMSSPGSFGMKMYSFLVRLGAKHPGLVMHFSFAPNTSVLRELQADTIDLGFVTELPKDAHEFHAVEIDTERLCLLVPAGFRGRTYAAYSELGFIAHPDGGAYATRILGHLFPKEFTTIEAIPVRGFVNSLVRIPDQVATGNGFTALPEHACRTYADQTAVRVVTPKGMREDRVYAVHRKRRALPRRFQFVLGEYAKSL